MKRKCCTRIFLSISVLIASSLACDVPGVSTAERDEGDKLGATETMQALATTVAGTLTLEDESGAPDSSVESESPADESGEPVASDTPEPSATPTPGPPMVSVSVDTNCRFGPGEVYEYQGALMVGEEAEVTGKLADESFWYIENPDAPPPYCWIWGMYASVTGDKSGIPVLTPPPTPTPEVSPTPTPNVVIDAYLKQVFQSGGEWHIMIRVANQGSVDLESFKLIVVDLDTNKTRTKVGDAFGIGPSLPPGQDDYPTVKFNYDVGMHNMEATIKVCTADGLAGFCIQTTFPFTP